jgi:hypothetical protein
MGYVIVFVMQARVPTHRKLLLLGAGGAWA